MFKQKQIVILENRSILLTETVRFNLQETQEA